MSGSGAPVNPAAENPLSNGFTDGTLLGGRIRYRQFAKGYRTGLEPVLLAAFVPARSSEHVLEAGCGAGAGLLCLHARIPELTGIGLEADSETAQLASFNFAENHAERCHVTEGSLPHIPKALRAKAPGANGRFHHAFANPPWHRHDMTLSPDPRRKLALSAPPEGWASWISALSRWVLPGGTVSLALPAAAIDEACISFRQSGCGSIVLVPLWPRLGRAAKIVLIRATVGGRGAMRLEPGLTLHEGDGSFTDGANAILRQGHSFPLSSPG